jgi:hypothetical protein
MGQRLPILKPPQWHQQWLLRLIVVDISLLHALLQKVLVHPELHFPQQECYFLFFSLFFLFFASFYPGK